MWEIVNLFLNKYKNWISFFTFPVWRVLTDKDRKKVMMNEDKIRETFMTDPDLGFRMLMEKFQSPMYWHIRRMVVSHEDAEDVLQETFIKVFRHLDDFRAESSLSTWIYRIAFDVLKEVFYLIVELLCLRLYAIKKSVDFGFVFFDELVDRRSHVDL